VNADGTNPRAVTPASRTYRASSIDWSPDSKWLIARSVAGVLDLVEVETGRVLPLGYTAWYGPAGLK
jgi:WD40 repeat protein